MNSIFGYTFQEIERAQQGHRLGRAIDVSTPPKIDGDLAKDRELLDAHGLDGLKAKGFFGTIDRLQRAGLVPTPA